MATDGLRLGGAGGGTARRHRPWRRAWRYVRALLAPVLIWALLIAALQRPLGDWVKGEESYDESALREWVEEARNHERTLAQMIDDYLRSAHRYAARHERASAAGPAVLWDALYLELNKAREDVSVKWMQIYQHLRALCEPATKLYQGQLLLFPTVYRMEVVFDPAALPGGQVQALEKDGPVLGKPVVWDSGLPRTAEQYQPFEFGLHKNARVAVLCQLHAFNKRQRKEKQEVDRVRYLVLLALAATVLSAFWLALVQGREREQERQRLLAQQRVHEAEGQRLEEERRRVEAERRLLEQRVATEAAERQALELKSHLYAGIGIMAGSYAHNIKNLLVRPNDLLRRCLEGDGLPDDRERMLREVQQTLGTVTERLQQILHTVRRDPTQAELRVLDLNAVLAGLSRTWRDLAQERWKLELELELADGPLEVAGDVSHLQQAVENLLFNARDATFEMRNALREVARRGDGLDERARRQAVLSAASWRGRVVLRTRRAGDEVWLEVSDNGAGMTEEVRRRCTETHFTTKRDNALYEGNSTGMGLGLSFVVAILEHHHARLEVESEPLRGTTFRARFPAAPKG
jgi:signal transduction histidine kinase